MHKRRLLCALRKAPSLTACVLGWLVPVCSPTLFARTQIAMLAISPTFLYSHYNVLPLARYCSSVQVFVCTQAVRIVVRISTVGVTQLAIMQGNIIQGDLAEPVGQ